METHQEIELGGFRQIDGLLIGHVSDCAMSKRLQFFEKGWHCLGFGPFVTQIRSMPLVSLLKGQRCERDKRSQALCFA